MKVDLQERLSDIATHWAPETVATYNDNEVMVVKVKGEFPFHLHEDTDDFFLILKGEVTIDVEGEDPQVCKPGQLCIVPKGRTHRPRAEREAEILLIEPRGVRQTNDGHRIEARKTA
ncbi:cupin domain-containing protein [Jannaschia sp. LMIT008]|uniref:cupin domain-containing protein n=1 Tax=Jannaschia maritima TaxID=3032585 RepID=UPI0028115DE8|nr:cupin domain-containing protein [Jannaschia sp. LMIT008]